MSVESMVKELIDSRGLRQIWLVGQMNRIMPDVNMNPNKLSAIVCGNRKMTGDEFLAFCKATETSPDYFCRKSGIQFPQSNE